MNIAISQIYNKSNLQFNGRKPKFSQEEIGKIIKPLIESELPLHLIAEKSGIPRSSIAYWFHKNYNMMPCELYRTQRKNKLREELVSLKQSGKTYKEIADIYGKTKRWVDKQMYNLEATNSREEMNNLMEENIPWMLDAGYTVERIHNALQVSRNTVYKWIKEHKNTNIVKYRQENNINIWRGLNDEKLKLIQNLTEFFQNGGSLKDAAKKFDISIPKILHLKKIFNIKSSKQIAREKMKELLPERISKNTPVSDMAKEFGVSETTIVRNIRKIIDKNYQYYKVPIYS